MFHAFVLIVRFLFHPNVMCSPAVLTLRMNPPNPSDGEPGLGLPLLNKTLIPNHSLRKLIQVRSIFSPENLDVDVEFSHFFPEFTVWR